MATKLTERWTPAQIIQATIAVVTLAAITYLAVTAQPVPDVLVALISAVSGFYLGQKTAAPTSPSPTSPGGDTWHA